MFVKLYAWYRAAIFLNPHSHLHPCSNLSEPPYSSHVDCILLIYFHIHATLLLYSLPNSLPLHGHATLDGILIAWTDWELYSSNILPRSCHSSSLSFRTSCRWPFHPLMGSQLLEPTENYITAAAAVSSNLRLLMSFHMTGKDWHVQYLHPNRNKSNFQLIFILKKREKLSYHEIISRLVSSHNRRI